MCRQAPANRLARPWAKGGENEGIPVGTQNGVETQQAPEMGIELLVRLSTTFELRVVGAIFD